MYFKNTVYCGVSTKVIYILGKISLIRYRLLQILMIQFKEVPKYEENEIIIK